MIIINNAYTEFNHSHIDYMFYVYGKCIVFLTSTVNYVLNCDISVLFINTYVFYNVYLYLVLFQFVFLIFVQKSRYLTQKVAKIKQKLLN